MAHDNIFLMQSPVLFPIHAAFTQNTTVLTYTPHGYIFMSAGGPETISCRKGELIMSGRTKLRSEAEYKDLIHRLNRIEGQIRGVRGMVENDAYCIDILTQVAATRCALNSFTKILLANHIKTCVADDLRNGHDENIDELVDAIQKLMK